MTQWAGGSSPEKESTRKNLKTELSEVVAQLAGPNPCPAERMLAEVAGVNWFALRTHEARLTAVLDSDKGVSLTQCAAHQNRVDQAHRRLMSSLKTLATVRRLGLPVVQVN